MFYNENSGTKDQKDVCVYYYDDTFYDIVCTGTTNVQQKRMHFSPLSIKHVETFLHA